MTRAAGTLLLVAAWFAAAFVALALCRGWRYALEELGAFAGLLLWPVGVVQYVVGRRRP